MPTAPHRPENLFPLTVVAPALGRFEPPSGAFDPEGDWTLAYGVHTIGQRGSARVGSLRLQRQAAKGGAVLQMQYVKTFPGNATGHVTAEIHCRDDALATPRRWRVATESLDAKKQVVPHTRIEKTGEVKDGVIEVRDSAGRREIPTPAAFAVNWALFDAVQRLPRKANGPLRFTLLDDFDQVKPNQALSFRGTTAVLLGGKRVKKTRVRQLAKGRIHTTSWSREGDRPVRLHAYGHVGDGVVPWVYWVDGEGRLLFAVSGLEAYLVEEART